MSNAPSVNAMSTSRPYTKSIERNASRHCGIVQPYAENSSILRPIDTYCLIEHEAANIVSVKGLST